MCVEDRIRENIRSIEARIQNCEILTYYLKCKKNDLVPISSLLKEKGYDNDDLEIADKLVSMYIKLKNAWESYEDRQLAKN